MFFKMRILRVSWCFSSFFKEFLGFKGFSYVFFLWFLLFYMIVSMFFGTFLDRFFGVWRESGRFLMVFLFVL